MKVIHINGYAAGKQQGFEGSEIYLIACCGMCTFAAVEPVSNASAKTFASAIMKIMLRYGLSHTVVLDKDSKFLGVCRESLDLLHINCHILSAGNHNPMLVERVNRFLNKGLKIMTNERDSIRVSLEAILLQLNQHSWQAEVGALDASDAIGSSNQTASISTDMTFQRAGRSGWWAEVTSKLWTRSNL